MDIHYGVGRAPTGVRQETEDEGGGELVVDLLLTVLTQTGLPTTLPVLGSSDSSLVLLLDYSFTLDYTPVGCTHGVGESRHVPQVLEKG